MRVIYLSKTSLIFTLSRFEAIAKPIHYVYTHTHTHTYTHTHTHTHTHTYTHTQTQTHSQTHYDCIL